MSVINCGLCQKVLKGKFYPISNLNTDVKCVCDLCASKWIRAKQHAWNEFEKENKKELKDNNSLILSVFR